MSNVVFFPLSAVEKSYVTGHPHQINISMQKDLPAWELIAESLQRQVAVMLLYVIASKGSSPGRQGFLMAVNQKGDIKGSLGGGIMEHKFVELAKAKLNENTQKPSLHLQVHNKTASQNQSGMICSGEQTIFMLPVKLEDAETIRILAESLRLSKSGTLQISFNGISFSENLPVKNFILSGSGQNFSLTVKTGFQNELFIIGAGHCSLALSKLMSSMDFYIRLFDNRPVLNTLEQNHFVHEKIHLDDYAEVADHIESGEGKYVVIMTNGYRDDDRALRALIHKTFTYLGLLGSKKKIEQLFASYTYDSFPPELISSVHAPAGVLIGSQTPEEIAVSIAAEIIRVKNAELK